MPHIVYIDISAKIEHWTKDSVVAIANDEARAYLVTGKSKQRARQLIRDLYGSKSASYRLLAILVYLAVKEELAQIRQIVIDRDYSGSQAQATIKSLLLHLLRQEWPATPAGFIRFENVRGSRADTLAKEVFDKLARADRTIRYQEIERVIRGRA